MVKRKYIFNILFILFAVIGLTGHVFGTSTNSIVLPENMSPEQKNLLNYIIAKSGCDAGEATLVLQMLYDQLTDTEGSAFLLYMMTPNSPANLPGMDPSETIGSYFTNSPQYIGIKNRFDGDLADFGRMTHKERLEYCKHHSNDVQVLLTELSDSGDMEKIYYVLRKSNFIESGGFANDITRLTTSLEKDAKALNANKLIDDGNELKTVLNSLNEPISDAIMEYDYSKAKGINFPIYDPYNFTTSIDSAIGNLNKEAGILNSAVVIGATLAVTTAVVLLPCGVGLTICSGGAVAPVLVILISIIAIATSLALVCGLLEHQLKDIVAYLEEFKKSLPPIK